MDVQGSDGDKSGLNVEHHETIVDHRDVIEVTVKAMLDGNSLLLARAAGLVYNISMTKVCSVFPYHHCTLVHLQPVYLSPS